MQGYKSDITVTDANGTLKFILESEQKTDRKAFLGGFLKAEVYAEETNSTPELIIVMQVFPNTTTNQIADHLRPYKEWLSGKQGGNLNISAIHVLSDSEYVDAIQSGDLLGTVKFRSRGHAV